MSHTIGTLNENPLHAALKEWYAQPGDATEVALGGYVIDIVQGNRLIEIQTGAFNPIRRKLSALLADHRVRLVHPIAAQKWIVKTGEDGEIVSRRRSPKRGGICDLFKPLVSISHLLDHPHFELEALLIEMEEVQHYDGKRGWRRRGWVVTERKLLNVADRRVFTSAADLADLLSDRLPVPFSTADLAADLQIPRRLAQQMAYCLRRMEQVEIVGKTGNAHLYQRFCRR
ncbi:MAG: hypothetical protein KF893_20290 [Caldilineaceae bacterium]|nr:hypothetical protein [Caldilineaceae bacterium]